MARSPEGAELGDQRAERLHAGGEGCTDASHLGPRSTENIRPPRPVEGTGAVDGQTAEVGQAAGASVARRSLTTAAANARENPDLVAALWHSGFHEHGTRSLQGAPRGNQTYTRHREYNRAERRQATRESVHGPPQRCTVPPAASSLLCVSHLEDTRAVSPSRPSSNTSSA